MYVITISPASKNTFDDIWPFFKAVISSGDTFVFPPDMGKEAAEAYWMSSEHSVFVATVESKVVGTYIIKANHMGLGSHIANASYMVDPNCHGQGVGKSLGAHSLNTAREMGFRGIQFNIVISTNAAAVSLWKKLGFNIIGTTPNGYRHKTLGFVDTYIMYQAL